VELDAHGDFNTPDEDPGGFLDGQGLAMIVGRCWQTLAGTVPGFAPMPEELVILAGARSFDPMEEVRLRSSRLTLLGPEEAGDAGAVAAAIVRLATRADRVHVHVDLDVHDPSMARANGYAAENGLSAADVQRIVRQAAERLPVVAATVASWDPDEHDGDRMRDAALDLLEVLAAVATPGTRASRAAAD
jgi:arginase